MSVKRLCNRMRCFSRNYRKSSFRRSRHPIPNSRSLHKVSSEIVVCGRFYRSSRRLGGRCRWLGWLSASAPTAIHNRRTRSLRSSCCIFGGGGWTVQCWGFRSFALCAVVWDCSCSSRRCSAWSSWCSRQGAWTLRLFNSNRTQPSAPRHTAAEPDVPPSLFRSSSAAFRLEFLFQSFRLKIRHLHNLRPAWVARSTADVQFSRTARVQHLADCLFSFHSAELGTTNSSFGCSTPVTQAHQYWNATDRSRKTFAAFAENLRLLPRARCLRASKHCLCSLQCQCSSPRLLLSGCSLWKFPLFSLRLQTVRRSFRKGSPTPE